MAKKRSRARTRNASTMRVVADGTSMVVGSAVNGLFNTVREETEMLLNRVERNLLHFRKQIVQKTFASLLIGVGALFIFAALLLYLVQLLNIRWPTALLGVGILMLLIAFLIQWQARRLD